MQGDDFEKAKEEIHKLIKHLPPEILPSRLSVLLHGLFSRKGIAFVNALIDDMGLTKYGISKGG